ncbi:MAG: F0F1 ATP synthase subunit B [Bacteroidia bacterium]|nr:F0F1 ATP synthase subunit B [Bacteroidia bacterium]
MELVTPEFGLIFWQTIAFLVVLLLLSRYAWKPILKALKDREQSIDGALRQAELAREEMKKLHADNEKLLDQARLERDEIMKAANRTAQEIRDAAKDKASDDVKRMLDDARKSIENEKQAALAEIRKQIATLSVEIAEKLIRHELEDPAKQRKLAEELINDIQVSDNHASTITNV